MRFSVTQSFAGKLPALQLSFPLPWSPHLSISIHLTTLVYLSLIVSIVIPRLLPLTSSLAAVRSSVDQHHAQVQLLIFVSL